MRNFVLRTLTAIGIVAVQVLCTYFSPLSLAALFLLLTALTVNEFINIISQRGEVVVSRPIVIETVVSDILYHHFPKKKEGFLTSVRSKIVQRSSLNRIAKETGLVELIQSTHINRTHNSFISGNAFEALVGAIYLDRGYAHCYRFFEERIIGKHIDIEKVAKEDDNFKSKLIEWSQKTQYKVEFELVNENIVGTNSPTFRSRVCIEGIEVGTGFGYSKKESQQLAAKEAMRHIRKKTELYTSIVDKHNSLKEENRDKDENMLPAEPESSPEQNIPQE